MDEPKWKWKKNWLNCDHKNIDTVLKSNSPLNVKTDCRANKSQDNVQNSSKESELSKAIKQIQTRFIGEL